jgi:hypothetical protein
VAAVAVIDMRRSFDDVQELPTGAEIAATDGKGKKKPAGKAPAKGARTPKTGGASGNGAKPKKK